LRRRSPRKYRLRQLPNALEKFFQVFLSGKLWIVTSFLAIAFAYYFNSFATYISADPFGLEQRQLDAAKVISDAKTIEDINTKLLTASNSALRALQTAMEIRASIVIMNALSGHNNSVPPNLRSALDKNTEARNDLATALGATTASEFESQYFTDFYKGYPENLRDIDNILLAYERFYTGALDPDQSSKLPGLLANAQSFDTKIKEATAALQQRSSNTRTREEHILADSQLELKRRDFVSTALEVRFIALTLLFILTVIFLILTYKSHQVPKPKSPLLGGRPDILKQQREKYRLGRLNRPR
jgi:hypothetical protein